MCDPTDTSYFHALCAELQRRTRAAGVSIAHLSDAKCESADALTRTHALLRGSQVVARLTLRATDGPDAIARLDAAALVADDLWKAQATQQTVNQLTTRIEQAYDQAHLLFRLAQLPQSAAACAAALSDAVERLLEISHLGWAVLKFVDAPEASQQLRGAQFLAGMPPIDRHRFDALLRDALGSTTQLGILRPDQSELASATGAEVLIQPLSFEGKRLGILAAGNNGGDDSGLSSFETQLFAACAGYLDTFHANLARIAQQQAMFMGMISALTASIDAKDPYTRGHSERVALLARQMALSLNLGEETADRYRISGLVHDVGKIGVPEAILCKAGSLTESEFALIRKHPQIGFEILQGIPGLEDITPGVPNHHERYDGRGYPSGLGGQDIPLLGRVLALADTFDAMSSNRSYRAKRARQEVLTEIRRCAGSQFDPALAETFVALDFAEFDAALSSHAEEFPSPPAIAA